MLMHAIAHGGCTDDERESALKADFGQKIPRRAAVYCKNVPPSPTPAVGESGRNGEFLHSANGEIRIPFAGSPGLSRVYSHD